MDFNFNILENNIPMFIGFNLLNAILVSTKMKKFRLQKRYLLGLMSEAEKMTDQKYQYKILSDRKNDYYSGLLLPYLFMIGIPIYLVWCLNTSILYSILITVSCILFNFFYSRLNSSLGYSFLFEKDDLKFPSRLKYTKDIHEAAILQYVRITLIKNKEIIFDSSDYIQINTYFGTFETIQPTIEVGAKFPIKKPSYEVIAVRVDFLCVFDDYSNFGPTEQNTGHKVPYNIQIFADVKEINDNAEHVNIYNEM